MTYANFDTIFVHPEGEEIEMVCGEGGGVEGGGVCLLCHFSRCVWQFSFEIQGLIAQIQALQHGSL
jgi:hypothetical protein